MKETSNLKMTKDLINTLPETISNIREVRLYRNNGYPRQIDIGMLLESGMIYTTKVLRGPQIEKFYKKCLSEGRKNRPNPNFTLPEKILRNIVRWYKDELLPVPDHLKITQKEVNDLYNRYYEEILPAVESNKKKSLLILLGELHNLSLLQNLIVLLITKEIGSLKCLFLEQDESYLQHREQAEKYLFNSLGSSDYLYFWAKQLNIPVKCVEDKQLREEFLATDLKEKKINSIMQSRDLFMASQIRQNLPEGTSILLCGANHIPGLRSNLEKDQGNYNILSLDIRDFQIRSKKSNAEKIVTFEEDSSEIFDAVLIAKFSHTPDKKSKSSLKSDPDKKSKFSLESDYEIINTSKLQGEIQREAKKGGAYIPDKKNISKSSPTPFFNRSKSFTTPVIDKSPLNFRRNSF